MFSFCFQAELPPEQMEPVDLSIKTKLNTFKQPSENINSYGTKTTEENIKNSGIPSNSSQNRHILLVPNINFRTPSYYPMQETNNNTEYKLPITPNKYDVIVNNPSHVGSVKEEPKYSQSLYNSNSFNYADKLALEKFNNQQNVPIETKVSNYSYNHNIDYEAAIQNSGRPLFIKTETPESPDSIDVEEDIKPSIPSTLANHQVPNRYSGSILSSPIPPPVIPLSIPSAPMLIPLPIPSNSEMNDMGSFGQESIMIGPRTPNRMLPDLNLQFPYVPKESLDKMLDEYNSRMGLSNYPQGIHQIPRPFESALYKAGT